MKKTLKTYIFKSLLTITLGASAFALAQSTLRIGKPVTDAGLKHIGQNADSMETLIYALPERDVLAAMAKQQNQAHELIDFDSAIAFVDDLKALGVKATDDPNQNQTSISDQILSGVKTYNERRKKEARAPSKDAKRAKNRIERRRHAMMQKYGEDWLVKTESSQDNDFTQSQ